MSDKPLYTLRVKCAPMTSPEGDKRYWHADHYGFSDDFNTPVVDSINGPYGPPPLQIDGQAATERYAGSLIGTVARLQGYSAGADVWRRVAVNNNGELGVQVVGGNVNVSFDSIAQPINVLSIPYQASGGFLVQQQTVPASSVTLFTCDPSVSYFRVDVVSGIGDLWVNLSGATAVVGEGILVTPTTPLVVNWPSCPNGIVTAIATVASTVANITARGD